MDFAEFESFFLANIHSNADVAAVHFSLYPFNNRLTHVIGVMDEILKILHPCRPLVDG
jgi:hypothetical protein